MVKNMILLLIALSDVADCKVNFTDIKNDYESSVSINTRGSEVYSFSNLS